MQQIKELPHPFGSRSIPEPRFSGFTLRSLYLRMRDGISLALDLRLPAPLSSGERVPTLLIQSRYWRSIELRLPFKWFLEPNAMNPDFREYARFFTGQGYALVNVDVRGTGASFGCWEYPWHEDTIQDSFEIVEWIVTQPWSNGNVGGLGISYLGTTAELLVACCHPAVKASAAMFSHPDAFSDIAFPGGILNQRFVKAWGAMDETLDRNQVPREYGLIARLMIKGVNPVPRHKAMLDQAVQDHCSNGGIYRFARGLTFRDQVIPDINGSMQSLLVERHLNMIRLSGAPICGYGSWMDAGTADAVIRRFLSLDSASMAVIGAWDHGGQRSASPYRPPTKPGNPPLKSQWAELVSFFDPYLKPESAGDRHGSEKILHYFTMGEEKWKVTSKWPPAGMVRQRWYLSVENSLSLEMPEELGRDEFTVDFRATTGLTNRWWELGPAHNQGTAYPNRREAGRFMLTYLTPPFERDLEICGYPVIHLYISSSEKDGAFFVYLEDVDESGRVRYITEGELRALHRKISADPGPYNLQVPYHSYLESDALPLTPGEVAELHFGLLPTSVLVRRGHRLRLGIAGHDHGTFIRIPSQGTPNLTFLRGPDYPSSIEFPAAFHMG
jgi:putative CocE/NonD family hydrolase